MITKHQLTQQRSIVSTYPNRGITIVRGEGVYLYDEKDNAYLDMTSNYGVNVLGHSVPEVINPIEDQLHKLVNLHGSFNNDTRSEATLKLIKKVNQSGLTNLKRIYWSNSGAEAVESAIKFAMISTGKSKFIAAKNAYHGKTFGALSATTSGDSKYQKPFKNVLLDFDYVEYGNIESLKSQISYDYAAVILEPIQGEAGVIIPSENYMSEVSELCRKNNVLLIIDEIQTGVGRTGEFLNIKNEKGKNENFSCDILCMAKGLGAGLPVGATIISEEINKQIPKGIQTSTFGSNPLSMSGVLSTINYIDNYDVLENCKRVGSYFLNKLSSLQTKHSKLITKIDAQGLMIGVELSCDPIEVIKQLQKEKIIAAPTSGNRIRFLPPLIITEEHVDIVIVALEKILDSLKMKN